MPVRLTSLRTRTRGVMVLADRRRGDSCCPSSSSCDDAADLYMRTQNLPGKTERDELNASVTAVEEQVVRRRALERRSNVIHSGSARPEFEAVSNVPKERLTALFFHPPSAGP